VAKASSTLEHKVLIEGASADSRLPTQERGRLFPAGHRLEINRCFLSSYYLQSGRPDSSHPRPGEGINPAEAQAREAVPIAWERRKTGGA
jgi:hypothetical protein